jgi:hydroxymethylbilane synthase
MGWDLRISQVLESEYMMYAVGQGALGLECRIGDEETLSVILQLEHLETRLRCEAERSFMRCLEGGCSVPLGVSTSIVTEALGYNLNLEGSVTSLDGKTQVKSSSNISISGNRDGLLAGAVSLGEKVAKALISRGASEILSEITKSNI